MPTNLHLSILLQDAHHQVKRTLLLSSHEVQVHSLVELTSVKAKVELAVRGGLHSREEEHIVVGHFPVRQVVDLARLLLMLLRYDLSSSEAQGVPQSLSEGELRTRCR